MALIVEVAGFNYPHIQYLLCFLVLLLKNYRVV